MKKKAIILFLSILFSFSSCSKKSELIPTLIQNSRTRLLDKLTSSETKDNNEISEKIIDGILYQQVKSAVLNLYLTIRIYNVYTLSVGGALCR